MGVGIYRGEDRLDFAFFFFDGNLQTAREGGRGHNSSEMTSTRCGKNFSSLI